MHIIITGGSGLIGSELTRELIDNGHEVTILSRNPQRSKDLSSKVKVAGWDGKTAHGWGNLLETAEAVVNLAGENIAGEKFFPARWTSERKKIILQSRLDAGNAILEAIRAANKKPTVLVQASAIGYYGPLGDEPIDETHVEGSDFMAKTCVAWEKSTAEVEVLGVRRVVIRTGLVLSANGGAFFRLKLPFKFFLGGPFGNGKQYYSWIHIADQVCAIRFLIENPNAHGIYNLTSPHPLTNAVLAKTIGKVMRRPSFIPVPAFAMKLLFGEVSTVVLDGQNVLPNRLLQDGYKFRFSQIDAAVRDVLGK